MAHDFIRGYDLSSLLKVDPIEDNLYSSLLGTLGCHQLRKGQL